MTVSVARLHAGDGYTYLTRQVATGDHERSRGQGLADYYTAHGAPPGHWHGRAAEALDVHGQVSEAQMKALFGEGLHPNADRLTTAGLAAGLSPRAAIASTRLGRRFPGFDSTREQRWTEALEQARAGVASEAGVPVSELSREQRHQARLTAAEQLHIREFNRPPASAAALERYAVKAARPTPQPVAGFDLTFTPVKSVSVMWGLGDEQTRTVIQQAHQAAVTRALDYVESDVARTRAGVAGVAQIDAEGIVAARFDHWDSRAGDPNLHTHVAIANRVRGSDGKWRTLDARTLYAANVTISELYNSALEAELEQRLGVEFVDVDMGTGRRPVRELEHVDRALIEKFSSRGQDIRRATEVLTAQYRAEHGHEPGKAAQLAIAQEATLTTRSSKGEAESLAEKQQRWTAAAIAAAGDHAVASTRLKERTHAGPRRHALIDHGGRFVGVDVAAAAVVRRVASDRATWRAWHLKAEAHRQLRGMGLSSAAHGALAAEVADAAVAASVSVEAPDPREVPVELQRADGASVFRQHGAERFTSTEVVAAEGRVLAAARRPALAPITADAVAAAVAAAERSSGFALDDGQRRLVDAFATADRQVVVGIGPAGAGKTQAMRALVGAAEHHGARVVLLAPSAAAAKVLQAESGAETADTLAKVLYEVDRGGAEHSGIGAGDLVLVDEAGMAATHDLDRLNTLCEERGAVLRLLGDDQQLGAVAAGGLLRTIAHEVGAVRLEDLHRFSDPAEAAATLELREGNVAALGFYSDAERITTGTREQQVEAVFERWSDDVDAGSTSVMIAQDRDTVRDLNTRARALQVARGLVRGDGVTAREGVTVAVGDTIVTRRNDRRLAAAGTDYVKNGDLWAVREVGQDGSLTVKHQRHHATVTLPSEYVAAHVEHGYAMTITRSQGLSVDQAHLLVDARMSREQLYVGMTRGRHSNVAHVVLDSVEDDGHALPAPPTNGVDVLAGVVARVDEAGVSAHETARTAAEDARTLARLEAQQRHAYMLVLEEPVDQALDDVLGAPGHATLQDDPAYHALRERLAGIAAAGTDPSVALREAVDQADLGTAESVAQVLHWRLQEAASATEGEHVDLQVGSPALQRWLRAQRSLIERRMTEVADRAITDRPEWAAAIGSDDLVRKVAVYRDRHEVADPTSALGDRPGRRGDQRTQWVQLDRQIQAAGQDAHEPKWVKAMRAGGRQVDDDLVREVASYRDRHGVDDRLSPIGKEPEVGTAAHEEWSTLREQIDQTASTRRDDDTWTRERSRNRQVDRPDVDLSGPAPERDGPEISR